MSGKEFDGKSALVTGAGGGIGRATAIALAAEGAKVLVADINGGEEETVAMIKAKGGTALAKRTDVTKAADVQAMVAAAVTAHGRLDIAINNAGIDPELAPVPDWAELTFDRIIGVNLKGAWLCMKYELEQFEKQGSGGAIVNIASIAGLVGVINKPSYTASKHGLIGLTKAAALQFAPKQIRINAVCPGGVATPIMDQNMAAVPGLTEQVVAANHPIGRVSKPSEIADAILYLASPRASFITGHALVADGGLSVQ